MQEKQQRQKMTINYSPMEFTYEEAHKLIDERLTKRSDFLALVNAPTFRKNINDILTLSKVETTFSEQIELEIKMVLAQYAPLSELAQNISESIGISLEVAGRVATFIDTIILEPIYDELLALDVLWEIQQKEEAGIPVQTLESHDRLELHPDGERSDIVQNNGEVRETETVATHKDGAAKPLTREELMNALGGKRTMASDIEAVRKAREEAKKE